MPDARARRGVPERFLLPPAPRDPRAAARWAAVGPDRRRSLAGLGPGQLEGLPDEDREVVAELARARLATRWRPVLGAPVLGWLVLMTVWGFGRSTYPASEQRYLLVGLALGAATWLVATVRVARRLRGTRRVLAAAAPPARGTPGALSPDTADPAGTPDDS